MCVSPLFMGDWEWEERGEYPGVSDDDGGASTANKSMCATRPDMSISLSDKETIRHELCNVVVRFRETYPAGISSSC